jgi:transcriptional regulator with XRE-family HTH domain
MESVLKKIEFFRLEKNISIDSISDHLEITPSCYNKIITGKSNLRYSKLIKIAEFLDIEIYDFFT